MQKLTQPSTVLSLKNHQTHKSSLICSSIYNQYPFKYKNRKSLSKQSSSLDFNQRVKEVEKIYRNLSDKKKKSSSFDRSPSPKYNPSSKYKNSGFFIPSKIQSSLNNHNNKSK